MMYASSSTSAINSAHSPPAAQARARGFSLVELLLAIFILGIGLIMVASIFPVGANWTRQTTEESVGQIVAQNALTVIMSHYGRGGDGAAFFNPDITDPASANTVLKGTNASPFQLQAIPGFINLPRSERCYRFGSNDPFPVVDGPAGDPDFYRRQCTYFWTALCRLDPAHYSPDAAFQVAKQVRPAGSYKYDVYILVFRKGSPDQVFLNYSPVSANNIEVIGMRDPTKLDPAGNPLSIERYIPSIIGGNIWGGGDYDPNRTPAVFDNSAAGKPLLPAIGGLGIGANSGTVFRQILYVDPVKQAALGLPSPVLIGQSGLKGPTEPIAVSPAADGSNASPLIYIYQATLTF